MKLLPSLLCLGFALSSGVSCRSTPDAIEVRGALRPELAGQYDGLNHGGPLILDLHADGTYHCLVLLYISSFGCGDVIGNGASRGEWFTVRDTLRFDVLSESDDMELSLSGASAECGDGRLELTIGDASYTLLRAN